MPSEETPTSRLRDENGLPAIRRVFQKRQRDHDQSEKQLQDLPVHGFVHDLKREFAHEIRHCDLSNSTIEEATIVPAEAPKSVMIIERLKM